MRKNICLSMCTFTSRAMPFEGDKQTEENLGDTTLDYSANAHSDSSSDIKRILDELGNINRRSVT